MGQEVRQLMIGMSYGGTGVLLSYGGTGVLLAALLTFTFNILSELIDFYYFCFNFCVLFLN